MNITVKGYTKNSFSFFLIFLFINVFIYGQNSSLDNSISERLNQIDQKIDNWQHKEAKSILNELEKRKENLSIEDKYAIELRRFKIEYYMDNNDENFDVVLGYLDKVKTINAPQLEYDYLSFIGEVFKISFNFENAIKYHKKALYNAEKRKNLTDITFTCWTLGSCFYTVEYINKPDFFKNKLDSALYFYNKALRLPENEKTNKFLPRIYDNLGRIETFRRNFNTSKTYINKALEQNIKANDSFGISISLNNLSKVFLEEKDYHKSIDLAKESNRYIKNKSLRIRRNNLEYIAISYYNLNQIQDAYLTMQKTLEVSEELTSTTFSNDIKKIETKYKVAREQQKTLEEKNKRLKTQLLLYITGFLVIISLIIGSIFYSRNQRYKKRFDELVEKNKSFDNKTSHIDLPPNTVKNILEGLDKFEREKLFLEKNISLSDLAKKLKTNSSYLSKVVNKYKNKKFTTYLNELRIQYTIQELTNNSELRLYTIEAIADHMGYNNAESFSSAFRKITNLYPSYFIKQLQKQ